MTEVSVLVKDEHAQRAWTAPEEFGDVLVASLSADPFTIDELHDAARRFLGTAWFDGWWNRWQMDVTQFVQASRGLIIALDSRWIGNTTNLDPHLADGSIHLLANGAFAGVDLQVNYNLADDWRMENSEDARKLVELLGRQSQARWQPDYREVLYGQLPTGLTDLMLEWSSAGEFSTDLEPWQLSEQANNDPIIGAHARWLTRPRADLGGLSPRDLMTRDLRHIDRDLADREDQWIKYKSRPAGVATTAITYRDAGFGTHEFALYYELVRKLLIDCAIRCGIEVSRSDHEEYLYDDQNECWLDSAPLPADEGQPPDREALIEHLSNRRDEWMDRPSSDSFVGYTARQLVELERSRIPVSLTPEQMMIDCECPLCQMAAEDSGIGFFHFDLYGIDDEFVFSCYCDREEWERESTFHWSPAGDEDESDGLDSNSNSTGGDLPDPMVVLIFRIGSALAGLIGEIKERRSDSRFVAELNEEFRVLRDQLKSSDDFEGEDIGTSFDDCLERVADAFPSLLESCGRVREAIRVVTERLET